MPTPIFSVPARREFVVAEIVAAIGLSGALRIRLGVPSAPHPTSNGASRSSGFVPDRRFVTFVGELTERQPRSFMSMPSNRGPRGSLSATPTIHLSQSGRTVPTTRLFGIAREAISNVVRLCTSHTTVAQTCSALCVANSGRCQRPSLVRAKPDRSERKSGPERDDFHTLRHSEPGRAGTDRLPHHSVGAHP